MVGTASEITGGKFKNGAASAAFMWAVKVGADKMRSAGYSNDDYYGEEVPEATNDQVQQTTLTDEVRQQRLKLLARFEIQGGTAAQQQQVLSAYVLTDDGYSNLLFADRNEITVAIGRSGNSGIPGLIRIDFGNMNEIETAFGENNYIKQTPMRVIFHEMSHAAGGYKWQNETKAMIHENRVMKQFQIINGTPQLAGERRYYMTKYSKFNTPKNANYLE